MNKPELIQGILEITNEILTFRDKNLLRARLNPNYFNEFEKRTFTREELEKFSEIILELIFVCIQDIIRNRSDF